MIQSAASTSRLFACAAALVLAALAAQAPAATVVEFNTVLGSFEVQLYDSATPQTVTNFLQYVTNEDYDDSIFHRLAFTVSDDPFILQGGGFEYVGPATETSHCQVGDIPDYGMVVNEFGVSNTRGTIAMAKLEDLPDSATNQFFFNLADNSGNLDNQNGGFTVFGHVVGDGMTVVDLLASQGVWPATAIHPHLGALPLIDYPANRPVDREDLEIVNSVRVVFQSDLMGDANGDQTVNFSDLEFLADNYGRETGASWRDGDFNSDQKVNLSDLGFLADNYGTSVVPLPEPTSLGLLAIGGIALLRKRRMK